MQKALFYEVLRDYPFKIAVISELVYSILENNSIFDIYIDA